MAANYAFHFHLALNFRLCTLKMLQLLGDSVPQAPCRGFAPGPMGGATGGVGEQCPPLLGPAGYRGYRGGSNENDLRFYSRQSLFSTVQVTEFQLPWL